MELVEEDEYSIFSEAMKDLEPKVVIEVGSYLGASTILFANLTKAHIYCVDTWLGYAKNHFGKNISLDDEGYPTWYHQFIKNIKEAGIRERVTPLPMTSIDGAIYLEHEKIKADVIYIDACHYSDFVFLDAMFYWMVLKPGGVIIFDDYDCSGWSEQVAPAVNKFMGLNNIIGGRVLGRKMIIRKKGGGI